jgi:hypothetical protein
MNGPPAVADTELPNKQHAGTESPAKNTNLSSGYRPPQAQ